MKPINKLTVDLLTEKYVNNDTLESKFKELFDRITVTHGDMFAESMIMELEYGTNWDNGNPALALYSNVVDSLKEEAEAKRMKTEISDSDYVDVLNLPKLLLVGVNPNYDDFFNNDLEACRKKLTLTKIAKDFGNIIKSNVLVMDIRNHINVLWVTLKYNICSIKDIKANEQCLDLMYPFKEELIKKSVSGKISVKEFDNICSKFGKESEKMIKCIEDLGFHTHTNLKTIWKEDYQGNK